MLFLRKSGITPSEFSHLSFWGKACSPPWSSRAGVGSSIVQVFLLKYQKPVVLNYPHGMCDLYLETTWSPDKGHDYGSSWHLMGGALRHWWTYRHRICPHIEEISSYRIQNVGVDLASLRLWKTGGLWVGHSHRTLSLHASPSPSGSL